MSIELKQAAQQALEALTFDGFTPQDVTHRELTAKAVEALRTAIQQAESEPVGFVDFQGTVFWHDGPPPADSLLFAAKPVSHDKAKWCEYVAGMVFAWLEMQENLKEEDRCIKAITGIIERRMWALPTTHPAPGVPNPVAWFDNNGKLQGRVSVEQLEQLCREALFQFELDAAMLAAK